VFANPREEKEFGGNAGDHTGTQPSDETIRPSGVYQVRATVEVIKGIKIM
jgi:hypothetical protein